MKKGDNVHWKWGKGEGEGKIEERFSEPVSRTIKGNEVTRNASADNPAYTVKQEDGDRVLKSESELEKGKKD